MPAQLTTRAVAISKDPLLTIHLDGYRMPHMPSRPALTQVPVRSTDEKITINLGVVDLGQIDLLVQEGFYANRTDLIRTAIRNQLVIHAEAVKQVVARKTLVLGIQHFSAEDLRAVQASGQ